MLGTTITKKEKYLYHLITEKKSFMANGITIQDYDSAIENIIDKPIFSSNQVIIWDCLRSVKINKPIYGCGRLLELY